MSNLPPCGACSYARATETLSICISPLFIGTLYGGRLILRSETGQEITYDVPSHLTGGESLVLTGLRWPADMPLQSATLAWSMRGDPSGRTALKQQIAVE